MYSKVPREVPTGKNEVNSSRSAERSEFIMASRAVRGPRMVPSELNSQRSSIRWCAWNRAWGGDLIVVVVPGVQRKSVL